MTEREMLLNVLSRLSRVGLIEGTMDNGNTFADALLASGYLSIEFDQNGNVVDILACDG